MNTFLRHWAHLPALALCLILSAGCTKASKARRLLTAAERDNAAQKYDSAEIEYQTVLSLSPGDPAAIRGLGCIYFAENRLPQSAYYLRKAHEQEPKNLEVELKLAEIYSGNRNTNEAIVLLTSVLQSDPANEKAMLLLAQISSSHDLAGLRQRLDKQLREAGPGAAACHSALGFIDLRLDKSMEAATEFEKASALDPKLAAPYLGQAYLCGFHKDVKGVGEALRKAAELSPVRSAARLKYVEFRLETGDAEGARSLLREITRQAPDYLPAWLYLMRIAFAEHKYDECKEVVDRILARDNSNFDALLQSGALSLAQHDVANALKTWQRLDDLYKNVKEVKYHLGMAHLLNNEKQKATADLSAALALDRDYAPAVLLLAQVDFRSGSLSDAISLLSQWSKNHPENAPAQLSLAEAYLAQGQPDRALAIYQGLAQMYPQEPEIPLRIGAVYRAQNNLSPARAALQKALSLAPDNLRVLQQITELDILEKRFDEARQRINAVMERNPKAAEPLILQGDIDLAETQTNLAEAAFSKAIELNADLPTPYLSLATLYVASHQDQAALKRLETLAQKTNEMALMMIGQIHQTAGRHEQARAAYERLLAVNPKNYPALNNLAYVDSEFLGRLDRALQLAQEARQIRPSDPHTADTLGWIFYKKHEYARALNLIQESAGQQPNSPEVQMHLGMTYYMMEEEIPARLHLQRALAAPDDFLGKDAARRRMRVLEINPTNAPPDVVQALQALMREEPQDPVPLSRLASIQEQQGDFDAAIKSLQKLLAMNNQVWPAMIKLSRLYADHKHDFRKALDWAKAAHTLAPNESRACAWLGELVYRSGGDYPWALSLLQQAAQQSFNEPSFEYYLGLASYAVGRVNEADASMQKVLRENESQPWFEQAKEFLAMRAAVEDPEQAQASAPLARQILAKEPNNVPALMLMALLAERRGEMDEAERIYDHILSIEPLFAPALRQMAVLYSRSEHEGDLEKAYGFAEKARAGMPNDPALAKTLGLLAYRRADYGRSMLLLRDTADKTSKDGEVSFYLGMDYYKLKQPGQSKLALQRALDLRVPDNLAAQARRTLIELR